MDSLVLVLHAVFAMASAKTKETAPPNSSLAFFEPLTSKTVATDFSDMLQTTVNFQPTPDLNISLSGSITNMLPKNSQPSPFIDRLLTSLFTGLFTAATPVQTRSESHTTLQPASRHPTKPPLTTPKITSPPLVTTTVAQQATFGMPSVRPKPKKDGSPGIMPEDFLPFSTTARLKPTAKKMTNSHSPFITPTTLSPPPKRPFIGFLKDGNVQFIIEDEKESKYPVSSPPGMTPLFSTPRPPFRIPSGTSAQVWTTRDGRTSTHQINTFHPLWTHTTEVPWRGQSLRADMEQTLSHDVPLTSAPIKFTQNAHFTTRGLTHSTSRFRPTKQPDAMYYGTATPTQMSAPPTIFAKMRKLPHLDAPIPQRHVTAYNTQQQMDNGQGPVRRVPTRSRHRPTARQAVTKGDETFYNFGDLKEFFAKSRTTGTTKTITVQDESPRPQNPLFHSGPPVVPQPLILPPQHSQRIPANRPKPQARVIFSAEPKASRTQRKPVHRESGSSNTVQQQQNYRSSGAGTHQGGQYGKSPKVIGQTVSYGAPAYGPQQGYNQNVNTGHASNTNRYGPNPNSGYAQNTNSQTNTGYNSNRNQGYNSNRNQGYQGNNVNTNHGYMMALHYGYNVDSYGIQPTTGLTLEQCFMRWPNMVIVNAIPYERSSGVSQADCLVRCLNSRTLTGIQCMSVIYIPQTMSCDLFDTSAGVYQDPGSGYGSAGCGNPVVVPPHGGGGYVSPPVAAECGNVFVSTVSPMPTIPTTPGPVTVTPGPTDMQCPVGTTPVYQRAEGYELLGSDGYISVGVTEQQCLESCRQNMAVDGTPYACLSFDYDGNTMTCILSTEAASPTRFGILSPAPGKVYYEKTCLTAGLSCPSGFIDRVSQQVLQGAGGVVQSAASARECIELCLDSQARLGVTCLSASFFYEITEFNCVLSEQSRQTNPGNFVPETESRVEYYGLDQCTRSITNINRSPFIRDSLATVHPRSLESLSQPSFAQLNLDFKPPQVITRADQPQPDVVRNLIKDSGYKLFDKPLLGYSWEEWSDCDRGHLGRRVRYKPCLGNPRCEVQTEWCSEKTQP